MRALPRVRAPTRARARAAGLTKRLQLDAPTLASMYSCTVTAWNDPAIAALNPGAAYAPPRAPARARRGAGRRGTAACPSRVLCSLVARARAVALWARLAQAPGLCNTASACQCPQT